VRERTIANRLGQNGNPGQEIMVKARKITFFVACVAVTLVAMSSLASAGAYSNLFVYGDSLSDLGNIYNTSGHAIPLSPPYYMGRFSNGPLAAEYLAKTLNTPLTSFAWGGATTGIGNSGDGGSQTTVGMHHLPGMVPQVVGSLSTIAPFASSSLFVVWGGPDDYISGGNVAQGITDILYMVGQLKSVGATHILVPGMPDLGLTPFYLSMGPSQAAQATAFSFAFDQALQAGLPTGVKYFDTFGFMHLVVANPGAYGFTDVTDPCLVGLTPCSPNVQIQNQYLFWDDLHPTTAANELLAAQFASAVSPEPSTLLMLCTGIAGIVGVLRRKLSA
jgi:phospholipase/lecithinase/hemolysin